MPCVSPNSSLRAIEVTAFGQLPAPEIPLGGTEAGAIVDRHVERTPERPLIRGKPPFFRHPSKARSYREDVRLVLHHVAFVVAVGGFEFLSPPCRFSLR